MKKVLLTLVVLTLLVGVVSAIDTEIKIKTLPYTEVQLTAYNSEADSFEALDRGKNLSDSYGDASFVISTDANKFDLILFVKKVTGETVLEKRLNEGYPAGDLLYLEVAPKGFEFIATPAKANETVKEVLGNETVQNISSAVNETILPESPGLTGFAIGDSDNFFIKNIYYIIGGVLAIVIIIVVIIIVRKKKKNKNSYEPPAGIPGVRTRKLSEVQAEMKQRADVGNANMLDEAEKKLRVAQEEIERLKGADKIKEAENRLRKDVEEVKRLRQQRY